MTDPVSQALEKFQEKDVTVRVSGLLFGAIPKGPPFVFYRDLAGAAARVGSPESALSDAALEATKSDGVARTLWVADKLDIADVALATYTGVSNVLSWLSGGKPGRRTFESDRQQAIDAVVKILGTAYLTSKLFKGTVKEQVAGLLTLPAGRELVSYLVVVEIALPFFDNVVEGGWNSASKHLQGAMAEGESKFAQITGEKVAAVAGMVQEMNGLLGQTMAGLHGHLGSITGKLRAGLPSILSATDSITGAMATAMDAIPAWRFMGARLAAEACVQR
jgi:hypothetical protein